MHIRTEVITGHNGSVGLCVPIRVRCLERALRSHTQAMQEISLRKIGKSRKQQ